MNERRSLENRGFKNSFSSRGERQDLERDSDRSVEKLGRIIEERDRTKIETDVLGTNGERLAKIEYNPKTREIISILPEAYHNTTGEAEQAEELICVTDDKGNITGERLTRAEVREQKKRYLIVTTMLYHGNEMLVQKRSSNKKLDPGKISTSAHGVAKEIFIDSDRVTDARTVAVINAALEMNEELRHDADPFTVKIWPGNHLELFEYANEQGLDNPNVVWLVSEAFMADDGYPLKSLSNPRTRGLLSGFIFSKKKPSISIDPSELDRAEWKSFRETLEDPQATEDLPEAMLRIHEEILRDNPYVRRYGQKLHKNWMRRLRGEDLEKP